MKLYTWLQEALASAEPPGPGATALAYRDTYLSWRGLAHRVDRRAQELTTMGIGAGSWVGLMLGNVPDFVILALALSKLEAVLVPVDPTLGPRDLDMLLDIAPLRALITRPRGDSSPSGAVGLRAGTKPVVTRFTPDSRRRLAGTLLNCHLYRRDPQREVLGTRPEAVLVTATAGGDPRGVLRAADTLAGIGDVMRVTLGLGHVDQSLCVAPLHQAYGFDFGLCAWLVSRSTLNLEDEVSPKHINQALRDQKIDFMPAMPATYGTLARLVAIKPLTVKAARYISSGSKLPAAVAEAFAEKFGVAPLSCYHSTDAGPIAIDRDGSNPTTVGTACVGVEVHAPPPSTPSALLVRSRGIAPASVPAPSPSLRGGSTAAGHLDDLGWLHTGDLAVIDAHGKITLVGREDDLVKIDGKCIALGEIEACLESFSKVREATARVALDDVGAPMVVASVVVAQACKAFDLIDHCAQHLAPHKVPRQIEFAAG